MRASAAYLFGLAVVAAGLCPTPSAAQKADAKSPLEGTWVLTKVSIAGNTTDEFGDTPPTMSFKGDAYSFDAGPQTEKGTFTTDAKAKPATIDLKITEGTGKGKTQLGIYELDGDTLKLCFANEGEKERPTKFASGEKGPEFLFATLKRKKAAK